MPDIRTIKGGAKHIAGAGVSGNAVTRFDEGESRPVIVARYHHGEHRMSHPKGSADIYRHGIIRTPVAGDHDLGMTIAIDITDIDGVRGLTRRLAQIVLANPHGWILAAGAIGNVILCPSKTVVSGYGHARSPGGSTGRIGHIDRAVPRHFDVAMNTTSALVRAKNRHRRAEGLASVIAARALRFGHDILRTVIDRVWIIWV